MNNGKKLWFRPRGYTGWGLTPQTWEGWLAVLAYLIVTLTPLLIVVGLASDGFRVNHPDLTSSQTLWLSISVIWIGAWVGAAFGFVVNYLKKNYPKEK